MKKVLLFAILLSWSSLTMAQSFIWEAFDAGSMPPAGWSLDGYSAQWSVSPSANAGGAAPEAKFTYTNGNGTSRLISPTIDLTGLTSVRLVFKHFYDWYSNGPKIGVATRSGGGAWNSVWEVTPTGNVGPQDKDITITNSNVGATDFQFCLYITGNLYNVDYWYLDNILLFNPLNIDAGIASVSTPVYFADPVAPAGAIMNFGNTNITSVDMSWQVDGGAATSHSFTGMNIPLLGTYEFSFSDLIDPPIGDHNLKIWINQVNGVQDDDQTNDTANKTVNKVCYTVPKTPCFEEFTSSTCGPCASFNSGFVPWCEQHEDEITLVKYQMDWPGSGDPYYTEEGGVRRMYYGVGWVPWLVGNGSFVDTDMGAVQNAFDQAILQPGLLDIAASHSINNTSITVDVTVLPFSNFNNFRVHIVVFEYITTGNVASNGETEFHHVMMKMIPDANGTTIDFVDRVPFHINETVDLAGTFVEDFADLGVAVIVQDYNTMDVYQSTYSVENGQFATEARLQSLSVDGTPVPGFDPDTFDYIHTLQGGATIVPAVTGVPMDQNAIAIVIPALELPGTTMVDVFGEDRLTHNTYNVNFEWATGVNEPVDAPIRVTPNPSAGRIIIAGAEHATISLVSTSGREMLRIYDFMANTLDLSSFPEGVYILNIEKANGNTLKHKIVLVK